MLVLPLPAPPPGVCSSCGSSEQLSTLQPNSTTPAWPRERWLHGITALNSEPHTSLPHIAATHSPRGELNPGQQPTLPPGASATLPLLYCLAIGPHIFRQTFRWSTASQAASTTSDIYGNAPRHPRAHLKAHKPLKAHEQRWFPRCNLWEGHRSCPSPAHQPRRPVAHQPQYSTTGLAPTCSEIAGIAPHCLPVHLAVHYRTAPQ